MSKGCHGSHKVDARKGKLRHLGQQIGRLLLFLFGTRAKSGLRKALLMNGRVALAVGPKNAC